MRQAAETWLDNFDQVPASVIEKMAKADEAMTYYDSDSLRLIASPTIECGSCNNPYDGELGLEQLRDRHAEGASVVCSHCSHNPGHDWYPSFPQHAYPCGWGTLFAPRERLDHEWILEHADAVAKLGLFVFESDDYGCLLGIDGAGFDFYEAYWIPLYRLRGLRWHETD